MNYKLLASMIVTGFILYEAPAVTHAEEGVLLTPIELKDEGQVFKTLSPGTRISFDEKNDQYVLFEQRLEHLLSPTNVLKVKEQKISTLKTNQNETPFLSSPSLLTLPFLHLPNETELTLIDTEEVNPNWYHVETAEGIQGYVLRDYIDVSYTTSSHATKAYLKEDHREKGSDLWYGDEISLIDLKDGQYTVKNGEQEIVIPSEKVTFEKPKTPYVLTASGETPNQLKIYGDIPFIQPLNIQHPRVTSRYGARWGSTHKGTDIGVPVGTPIYAVADGTVQKSVSTESASKTGWGNYVKLNHGTHDTLYAHLQHPIVRVGEVVKQGQKIGYTGNSGRSTGPHLHFELYENGEFRDSYWIVNQPLLYR